MRLRDIDLRWSNDDPAPESFRKSGPVGYLFHRELRALKIDTPGFVKINVYCEPRKRPYTGKYFDGVTDAHVACRWKRIEGHAPQEMARAFAALLTEGAETVLSWFRIPQAAAMTTVAEKVLAQLWTPLPFGKAIVQGRGGNLSARLSVSAAETLEYSTVSVTVKKGRATLAELPVCTTFPTFDYALENLESLRWVSKTQLQATFAKSAASDRSLFGRRNFDGNEFAHVQATDSDDRRRRTFTVDVPPPVN